MSCKDCNGTGKISAWNKYHDSGFSTWSFRCHCVKGYTHPHTRIPQWNKSAHPKTFIVSMNGWDSPHRPNWENKIDKEDRLNKPIKIDEPSAPNIDQEENNKKILFELLDQEKYDSPEMKVLKKKIPEDKQKEWWLEYKETKKNSRQETA